MNYIAILVSGILYFAIGAFWYSPAGFGKQWQQLMGFDDKFLDKTKAKGGMGKIMAVGFFSNLVTALVLAKLINATGAISFFDGALVGFWIWLGFIATITLGSVLWEGKPIKLFYLNNLYNLISLTLIGGILSTWV